MSAYVRAQTIIEKLRLEMPVEVTLPDPWTGRPFTVRRDNILALLAIDTHNLLVEGQSIPPLYAEAGRLEQAATFAAAKAEMEYRRWKAQKAMAFRAASGKVTKDQVEESYRLDPAYEEMCLAGKRFEALAGLAESIRWAFQIKGQVQHDQTLMLRESEKSVRLDDEVDRMREMETLERHAAEVFARSRDEVEAMQAGNAEVPRRARGL